MNYVKGILSGLAAIILAECVPGSWSVFRGIGQEKATGLAVVAGGLAESVFSPLCWILAVLFFALFFAASRLKNKLLRVFLFWIDERQRFRLSGSTRREANANGIRNSVYYKLAAKEYGANGSSSCNSSKGNNVGESCIFYDVTEGDLDVVCTGTENCYAPCTGDNCSSHWTEYGVLSTSDRSYQAAYDAGIGWDFATGYRHNQRL